MTLSLSLGIKKAATTVIAHPALVLTPVFSFWTFGPRTSGRCCAYKIAEPKICLSFRLTWINSILTFCGTFVVVAITYHIKTLRLSDNQLPSSLSLIQKMVELSVMELDLCQDYLIRDRCLDLMFVGDFGYLFSFAIATICLLLIQFLDKCSCCFCRCFKESCLPMTEKNFYDTENNFCVILSMKNKDDDQ